MSWILYGAILERKLHQNDGLPTSFSKPFLEAKSAATGG